MLSTTAQMQNLISEFLASQSQQTLVIPTVPQEGRQLQNTHKRYFGDQNVLENVVQERGEFDKELFLQALRDFKCSWDTNDADDETECLEIFVSDV